MKRKSVSQDFLLAGIQPLRWPEEKWIMTHCKIILRLKPERKKPKSLKCLACYPFSENLKYRNLLKKHRLWRTKGLKAYLSCLLLSDKHFLANKILKM